MDELKSAWWGLRFADAATERDYRRWYVRQALPFVRGAMIASVLAWLTAIAGYRLATPEHWLLAAAWICGVMLPLNLICYAITYVERLLGWVLPFAALVNLVAGSVALHLAEIDTLAGFGWGAVTVVAYFAFTIIRLHPRQAFAAVIPYVAAAHLTTLHAYEAGSISHAMMIAGIFLPWMAVGTGGFACVVLELTSRRAYRDERIIAAQNEVIAHERSRAESLLHSILPASIANKLKTAPTVIAERMEEVTVLFADVVGFTPLAASLPPEQVVIVLNDIFTRFDTLAQRHGVEKIKTIGDAYMAVAGAPNAREDHAVAAAQLALEMREVIAELRRDAKHDIRLRIGLSTGPAIAGVIGVSKFAYDLWGDTVNTAARMESHGVPDEIQVAESTYAILRGRYELRERGTVEIKGKGAMKTWLLVGPRV